MDNKLLLNKTCCFSGNRYIPSDDYYRIKQQLTVTIKKLIQEDIIYFGTGGAIGFDTIAAKTIIELRNEFPNIKLILVLPCKNQAKHWNTKNKTDYDNILKLANKVVYISQDYTNDCMLKRNRHLVDNSSCCVYYNSQNGAGTSYTIQYAKSKGLKLFQIG